MSKEMYTDEQLLDYLKTYGSPDGYPVAQPRWDTDRHRLDGVTLPSSTTVRARFSGWPEAWAQIGVNYHAARAWAEASRWAGGYTWALACGHTPTPESSLRGLYWLRLPSSATDEYAVAMQTALRADAPQDRYTCLDGPVRQGARDPDRVAALSAAIARELAAMPDDRRELYALNVAASCQGVASGIYMSWAWLALCALTDARPAEGVDPFLTLPSRGLC